MTNASETFRTNVITLLARKRLNRSDLAERLEVTPAYVTQVLNGYQQPGLGTIEKWAIALGTTPARLLTPPRTRRAI